MNFRTATLLVLGMFGSFAVALATMVVLFWSPSGGQGAQKTVSGELAETPIEHLAHEIPAEPLVGEAKESYDSSDKRDSAVTEVDTTESDPAPQTVSPYQSVAKQPSSFPKARPAGRSAQQNIQLEREEMKLLKREMQRRLQQRIDARERKLGKLARQCEIMTAGEGVQILVILDDSDLRDVLKRMDRETALQIAALLHRLGRGSAISLK